MVVLVRHRPVRAVTLAGVLGVLLAFVPLVIAPDPGALRWISSFVVLLTSAALIFLGRSQRVCVELVRKHGGLGWGPEPLPPPSHVLLAGDATTEPPTYQAFVGWEDGRRRLALERDTPAEVLRDAVELANRLELDLRPGWGLEHHFPATGLAAAWDAVATASPESGATSKGPVELPLWPVQKRAAAITFVAGLFVLVVTAALIRSPHRSVPPSALSLALPVLAAGVTIVIGAVLLGIRRSLELSAAGIASTTVVFGFPCGKRSLLGPPASRVFGVAPDQGPVRHVLFATASGPISVPADREGATRLAARIETSSQTEAEPDERPARYFSTLPRS